MEAFPGSVTERLQLYATAHDLTLSVPLGRGMDGEVRTTSRRRRVAVKAHERTRSYRVEKAAYQRLAAADARFIQGHAVPSLLGADDDLGVLELEIVAPPFVLDFGKARLDEPLELVWPEHVLEERWAYWESLFEPWQWPRVLAICGELEDRFGVYLEDIHPGNIRFASATSDQP